MAGCVFHYCDSSSSGELGYSRSDSHSLSTSYQLTSSVSTLYATKDLNTGMLTLTNVLPVHADPLRLEVHLAPVVQARRARGAKIDAVLAQSPEHPNGARDTQPDPGGCRVAVRVTLHDAREAQPLRHRPVPRQEGPDYRFHVGVHIYCCTRSLCLSFVHQNSPLSSASIITLLSNLYTPPFMHFMRTK